MPIAPDRTGRGTWEKITPTAERSMFTLETRATAPAEWIDLALSARVAVRVSEQGPLLESVTRQSVSTPAGADFAHGYRLHFAEPPVFDPQDPAVVRS